MGGWTRPIDVQAAAEHASQDGETVRWRAAPRDSELGTRNSKFGVREGSCCSLFLLRRHVELEEADVAVFHDVLLALHHVLARRLARGLRARLPPVLIVHHLN